MSVLRRSAWRARPWAAGWSFELAAAAAWRVSVATIESNGPFTAFPGWFRHTALIRGAGIGLGDAIVTPDSPEVAYPGDPPPFCSLIDGPVMVLNAFTAPGASAYVRRKTISGATSIGAATVALCLDAGLTYDGHALGELDAVCAPEFTVTGTGSMLIVSVTV